MSDQINIDYAPYDFTTGSNEPPRENEYMRMQINIGAYADQQTVAAEENKMAREYIYYL